MNGRAAGAAILAFAFASAIGSIALCGSASAADEPLIVDAQKFFKQYTDLERAYDPSMAELFAPTATIKDTRLYQDGTNKVLTWTGESYKRIIKARLPVAKARSEQFVYSQISFARDGGNVRIKCSRSSSQKKSNTPMEMVVAPGARGWKILEQISQSQP